MPEQSSTSQAWPSPGRKTNMLARLRADAVAFGSIVNRVSNSFPIVKLFVATVCVSPFLSPLPVAAAVTAAAPVQWSCHCDNISLVTDQTGCGAVVTSQSVHDALCTPTCHEDPPNVCWTEITYTLPSPCSGSYSLKATAGCETEGLNQRRHNAGAIAIVITCGNCVP